MSAIYFKNGNTFFAKVEQRYILANIKNDEYYLYDGDKADYINSLINMLDAGGSKKIDIPWSQARPADQNLEKEILNAPLFHIYNDIITIESYSIDSPKGNIILPWAGKNNRTNIKYRFLFTLSFIIGTILIKLFPAYISMKIIKVIKSIAKHKTPDTKKIEIIAESFIETRKYLYTAKDKCYYEALILSIYLSLLGLRPNWVFGVKLNPFKAHCWIEVGGYLFNESPGTMMSYSPLFKI